MALGSRIERNLEIERHLHAVLQTLQRLAGEEMHVRRGELQIIVAPIQGEVLRPHREAEARDKRQDQPPCLDGPHSHPFKFKPLEIKTCIKDRLNARGANGKGDRELKTILLKSRAR